MAKMSLRLGCWGKSKAVSAIISKISIEGYKSIRKLTLELRAVNVLIGANGAGKSNFVSFFRFLHELIEQRLQIHVATDGGADASLFLGPRETQELKTSLEFGRNGFEFTLLPTVDNRFVFERERSVFYGIGREKGTNDLGSGGGESQLRDHKDDEGMGSPYGPAHYVFHAMSSWVDYHFHDTSPTAAVRRQNPINDNRVLRRDAANLAAFLFRIKTTHPTKYSRIRDVVRLAAPFFDDFKLRPVPTNEELIQLEWTQQGSDYSFRASQLSDGTLRFICLATALLQPYRPATVLFDEPELGLHPYALTLLGNLFEATSPMQQVIISTQSALLLNEFSPRDVIVVERERGESTFRRLDPGPLSEWLQDYGLVTSGRRTCSAAGHMLKIRWRWRTVAKTLREARYGDRRGRHGRAIRN